MRYTVGLECKEALDTRAASAPLAIKSVTEDGQFEGYASTFGNVDQGMDEMVPGAFRRTLAEKKLPAIKMLRDHDSTKLIGSWLEMREDERGLYVKGQLFSKEIALAAETLALMRAKALDSMSIGYRTIKSMWDEARGVRQLMDVDLWEVSVVPFAMNPLATIDAVKGDVTARDVERILRDANVPNSFAKLVTLHGFDGATKRLGSRREAGDGGNDSNLAAMINAASESMKGLTR